MNKWGYLIWLIRTLGLTATLGLTGCRGFDSSKSAGGLAAGMSLARKPFGTCDRKEVVTINLCTEAVGADYDEPGYLGILKSSCESSGGIFSAENCAAQASVGLCIVGPGESNVTYVSYYPPQYSTLNAKSACEGAGGIYVAP